MFRPDQSNALSAFVVLLLYFGLYAMQTPFRVGQSFQNNIQNPFKMIQWASLRPRIPIHAQRIVRRYRPAINCLHDAMREAHRLAAHDLALSSSSGGLATTNKTYNMKCEDNSIVTVTTPSRTPMHTPYAETPLWLVVVLHGA